jgi:Tol biopolymer transport system component
MAEPTHAAPPSVRAVENSPKDRLDSWKEIAAYLNRDVTTVQRWEKREGMPVHRHLHDSKGSVYASRVELDGWVSTRNLRAVQQNGNDSTSDETPAQPLTPFTAPSGKAQTQPPSDTAQAPDAQAGVVPGNRSRSLKLRWLLLVACLILTAVIGVWIRHRLLYDSPTHRVTEQRVTSNSPDAPVAFAVVSPDGKYLAYSDPTGLYLRVIASGETRHWDVPKDFIASPTGWFPDGTHLLVARFDGPTPSLWKLSLLGAAPRKLIDDAGPASVSPDGTRIAFVTSRPNPGNQLWVMGADGSNPRKIAEASPPEAPTHSGSSIVSPAWSPNSRRIACIEHHWVHALAPLTDLSSVWTRDADGRDLQLILKDTVLGSALSWAPDGRILFASHANTAGERDDEEIHSIRVDERTGKATGQPKLVTTGVGSIGGITVTSDGKRLVLWRRNTQEQAFISEFDDSTLKWKTPRRLTLDANGNMATDWLSDSRTVLFVSNRNGTWTLFKQAIDETTADVLVGGHGIYLPRLSADGSQVLYLSQTDPADPSVPISLMRLPVTGGPPQLVLRDIGLGNYQCARLPSTLCIATKFEKDEVIFFAFDPGRGIGRELLKIRGLVHDWSLSPDGRTLADLPHGHSIRFFSVENGVAREDKTVTLNEWPIENGDWNADGSGLLIPSITPTGMPVILEVNRAGKASVVLEGAANTPFEFMIQAPDGHHGILGAIVPGDNNAWMIDNF